MSDNLSETFRVLPEEYPQALVLLADAFASYSQKGFDTEPMRQWLIAHGAEGDWRYRRFLDLPPSYFWLCHLIDHLLRNLGAVHFEIATRDTVHEVARAAKIRGHRLVRERRGAIYTALDHPARRHCPGVRVAAKRVCRQLAKYLRTEGVERLKEELAYLIATRAVEPMQ